MSYSEPPPPSYGAPQQPAYGGPPKNSGKAVAALVTGVVGLVTFCCGLFVVAGSAAIVLGFLARKEIAASGGRLTGNGMALAGIVLGVVEVVMFAVSIVLVATGVIEVDFTQDLTNR